MIINLTIPKEIELRVLNGYCLQHGQPVGTVEFMTKMLYEHIAEMVRHAETSIAVEANKAELEVKQAEIETARVEIMADVKSKITDVLTKVEVIK
jgi:hypothetical protein